MPNKINLTVELHADDRARLDKIIDLLSAANRRADTLSRGVEMGECEPPKEQPAPVKEEPQPTVTLDDVRRLVQKLATPNSGKREAVRDIVKKYADSVSAIPADKLAEVHAELVALDKGA